MKKSFISLLSVFLVLVLFVALIPGTAMARGVSNTVNGSNGNHGDSDRGNGGGPCAADLKLAKNYEELTLPKYGSYLNVYSQMYIDAEKGHSVRVHSKPDGKEKSTIDYAYHGSYILALAEEDGCYCVFYWNQNNNLMAGWVDKKSVSYSFPGEVYTIGKARSYRDVERWSNPPVSWANEDFVGTNQGYTLMNYELDDCLSFTLDYQVVSRNGSETQDCLGYRTIYVNDGHGWDSVGSFYLDELVPVHVTVYLDRPVDILAVAAIADCEGADTFIVRQSVMDVILED